MFFAPTHLRAGGSWSAQLAQEIADATAFILLVGPAGVGKWQVPEYDEALDTWVNSEGKFPLMVVLLEGQTAPGLPFLRRLHWIITPGPTSEKDVARLFGAAAGGGSTPGELWRYTSPYRMSAAASILLLLLCATSGNFAFPQTGTGWIGFGAAAVFYGFAIITFFFAISMIGPVRASLFSYSDAVISAVLGVVVLGQAPSLIQVAGITLVIVALISATVRRNHAT